MREHKVDIERAMLFGMRGSQNGIQYSEGIVGHILKNGTNSGAGAIGSYSSGAPYLMGWATSETTYDNLLGAFEVMYDPARGGSASKLCLASLPVESVLPAADSTVTLVSPPGAANVTAPST